MARRTTPRRSAFVRAAGLQAAPLLLLLLLAAAPAAADWLDDLDRARTLSTADGRARAELSALLDLEGYWVDQRPPGLIAGTRDGFLFNPRLSLFLDAHFDRRLYAFVQARVDQGFDPRARASSARFDEYLLRWSPLADDRLGLQAGKFATVVGNWVPRHDSWRNPFVNAPLPYENVTVVSDLRVVATPADFLARRRIPDRKDEWVPLVWGPSYASGAALLGRLARLDYALEVKNAALSSRPEVWDGRSRGWRDPTMSARLGWRPSAAWALGLSGSRGAYFRRKAAGPLPAGDDLGSFAQETLGLDARWAWRHLELWSELFLSRFEVPNVGDADSLAYYLEGRWKLRLDLWAALRWNQQFFGDVADGAGGERAWDRDAWRVDVALGHRLNRHLQAKLQYAYLRQRGDLQQGEQLVALQATLKF